MFLVVAFHPGEWVGGMLCVWYSSVENDGMLHNALLENGAYLMAMSVLHTDMWEKKNETEEVSI